MLSGWMVPSSVSCFASLTWGTHQGPAHLGAVAGWEPALRHPCPQGSDGAWLCCSPCSGLRFPTAASSQGHRDVLQTQEDARQILHPAKLYLPSRLIVPPRSPGSPCATPSSLSHLQRFPRTLLTACSTSSRLALEFSFSSSVETTRLCSFPSTCPKMIGQQLLSLCWKTLGLRQSWGHVFSRVS